MILSLPVLKIVTNTFVIAAWDIALDRTVEPIIDIGVEDNSVKAPARKTLVAKPNLEVATTQESITVPNLEALMVTTEMR